MISGVIGLVLVVPTIVVVRFFDSGFARLLAFVFLQYPGTLIAYLAGEPVSYYALGIVAWILWSVVAFGALWCAETIVNGLRGVDRPSRHA